MILTIQSTTFGAYGGIPGYNRLICRALNEFPEADNGLVLVATDNASDIKRSASELPRLRLHAFDQNRVALTRSFLSFAMRENVDLILVGHVNYAPLAWLLKRFQPRLRYGVMLYGIEAWQPLSNLRRRALQNADFLISISDYTKQKAAEVNALDSCRFHLLPNAVGCIQTDPSQMELRTSSLGSGTRLLSVCRLEQSERYKGVDKVIECLPDLAKRIPGVQYTVVGGGTDLERHKALAERLGVANRVRFMGFITDEALGACYRECDVFVMPSAGEGFGFVFLEAMKYGKPIVAARSGGAPEVVRDGVNGKLVEYGNKHQLLGALVDLCLNRDERESLGDGGYRRLQENYTFEHFKQKFMDLIRLELPTRSTQQFSPSHESRSCAS
ncbi:MAG: glycosyltransferase family 4 protein [Pyrinomonadaceae bacterium]|nr:glycosyltransferase family 4 protein [Pyrinomonadaceae bacterium]